MKHILYILIGLSLMVSGCKKEDGNASDWTGVYNGNTSGNTVQRVIVSEVNSNTLKMELQILTSGGGGYYTFATIDEAKISGSTAAVVDEDGTILGSAGTYKFAGGSQRDSDTLTISGSATNKKDLSDVKLYYFKGSK